MRPLLCSLLAIAAAQSTPPACIGTDTFVAINLDGAALVRSNLGGQGGRCSLLGECDEVQSATTLHEIYIRDVGVSGDDTAIDLRITNQSEYHAWNPDLNGIKRSTGGRFGSFGAINLLGPREEDQAGYVWHTGGTFVELLFEVVGRDGSGTRALTLPRTYLTFYDFDASATSSEVMQINPSGSPLEIMPATSELIRASSWSALLDEPVLDELFPTTSQRQYLESWGTPVSRATARGVGADNPIESYVLTQQQVDRSVMVRFDNVSSFRVRYAIIHCCTTGAPRLRILVASDGS